MSDDEYIAEQVAEMRREITRIADAMPSERSLFAALCLAGMLADSEYNATPSEAGKTAVRYANALLLALQEDA